MVSIDSELLRDVQGSASTAQLRQQFTDALSRLQASPVPADAIRARVRTDYMGYYANILRGLR